MRLPAHMRGTRSQHGFNLIELMIALALGLIIILGASNIFLSSKQSYRTNAAISQIQENSRIAFELLARDFRQARLTGCGNLGTVTNLVNNNATNANWFADFANRGLIGFDGAGADTNPALTTGTASGNHKTGTDNITLIGAGDVGYGLNADYVASDGLDIVESSPDLKAGDLIFVCDPSQANIVQITSLNGDKFRLQTGVGTPGNSAGLSYIYSGSNTLVSPLTSVTWYIGCNPTTVTCDPAKGETSLYRLIASGDSAHVSVTTQAQEMARGVASMDLTFHHNGASDFVEANTVTSAEWTTNDIDAVRVALRFVAIDQAGGANKLVARDLSTTITLRNPPKD